MVNCGCRSTSTKRHLSLTPRPTYVPCIIHTVKVFLVYGPSKSDAVVVSLPEKGDPIYSHAKLDFKYGTSHSPAPLLSQFPFLLPKVSQVPFDLADTNCWSELEGRTALFHFISTISLPHLLLLAHVRSYIL